MCPWRVCAGECARGVCQCKSDGRVLCAWGVFPGSVPGECARGVRWGSVPGECGGGVCQGSVSGGHSCRNETMTCGASDDKLRWLLRCSVAPRPPSCRDQVAELTSPPSWQPHEVGKPTKLATAPSWQAHQLVGNPIKLASPPS